MPLAACGRQPAADLVREVLAERQRSLPPVDPLRGSTGGKDAAHGQQLIRHAQAAREAEGEPDRVADDLGREAAAGAARAGRCRHPARLLGLATPRKPTSSQLDNTLADAGGDVALAVHYQRPELGRVHQRRLAQRQAPGLPDDKVAQVLAHRPWWQLDVDEAAARLAVRQQGVPRLRHANADKRQPQMIWSRHGQQTGHHSLVGKTRMEVLCRRV